jgi:hypothetical protein
MSLGLATAVGLLEERSQQSPIFPLVAFGAGNLLVGCPNCIQAVFFVAIYLCNPRILQLNLYDHKKWSVWICTHCLF